MKISSLILILLSLSLFIFSCKKDNGGNSNPSATSFVRIQEGVDPLDDTVYLLTYDSAHHIKTIQDSIDNNLITLTYDASGNLTGLSEAGAFAITSDVAYTYDANNLLTQIEYVFAGEHEIFTFEYTNGVLARQNFFTDAGLGGDPKLWTYSTYVFSGGNISTRKDYTKADVLSATTNYTYSSQANPFKTLGLINVSNLLGTDLIANFDTYFCANQRTGSSAGNVSTQNTITKDGSSRMAKETASVLDSADPSSNSIFTWNFSY